MKLIKTFIVISKSVVFLSVHMLVRKTVNVFLPWLIPYEYFPSSKQFETPFNLEDFGSFRLQ